MSRAVLLVILIIWSAMPNGGFSAAAQGTADRRSDLAAVVAGVYVGHVISDARGSSREGVTVIVTRLASNVVEVASNYSRIPTVRIRIQQALNAIVQADGHYVFLIQRDVDPDLLSLTIDDASLSVRRQR